MPSSSIWTERSYIRLADIAAAVNGALRRNAPARNGRSRRSAPWSATARKCSSPARSAQGRKRSLTIRSLSTPGLYAAHAQEHVTPYEGIPELLDALHERGIRTACVTNKDHTDAAPMLQKFFGEGISHVEGRKPGRPTKPAPDAVYDALKAFGVDPSPRALRRRFRRGQRNGEKRLASLRSLRLGILGPRQIRELHRAGDHKCPGGAITICVRSICRTSFFSSRARSSSRV